MLLRIEVAAFHPAMPPPVAGRRNTEMAVSVRAKRARAAVSSLWSYSSAVPESATGRPLAVTLPCGVRTFLDELAPTAIVQPVLQHVFYYRRSLCPPGRPGGSKTGPSRSCDNTR